MLSRCVGYVIYVQNVMTTVDYCSSSHLPSRYMMARVLTWTVAYLDPNTRCYTPASDVLYSNRTHSAHRCYQLRLGQELDDTDEGTGEGP